MENREYIPHFLSPMEDPYLSLYLGYEFPSGSGEHHPPEFESTVREACQKIREGKLLPPVNRTYSTPLEGEDVKKPLQLLEQAWNKGGFVLYQLDRKNGIVESFALDEKGEVEVDTPFDAGEPIMMRAGTIVLPAMIPSLQIDHDLTHFLEPPKSEL